MKVIIFISSFLIFIFSLFKLIKDDHVFLRKNIKLEEIFDIVFIVTIVPLFFMQIISTNNNFALPQGVAVGALGLFLIGKYRKFPVGRLFDFFALSFAIALPFGFTIAALFSKRPDQILYFIGSFVYLLLALFFAKIQFPRIMNRTLREGSLGIYIIMSFSFISLLLPIYYSFKGQTSFLNAENIVLSFLFIVSVGLFFRQMLNKT